MGAATLTTMDEGYNLATDLSEIGSRRALLKKDEGFTNPFDDTCADFCTFSEVIKKGASIPIRKIDDDIFTLGEYYRATLYHDKCWQGRQKKRRGFMEFYEMLLGYQSLASQLSTMSVLVEMFIPIADGAKWLRGGSKSPSPKQEGDEGETFEEIGTRFLETTRSSMSRIRETMTSVKQKVEKLTKLGWAKECASTFEAKEPLCGLNEKAKKWGSNGHTWVENKCIGATCANDACRKVMTSSDWF